MFDQPVAITNQGERARTNMHYAATLGGMAFSNAFLGINHSLAHKTGGEFGLPHGLVITIVMQLVIRFNGASDKVKRNPYPRYEVYRAQKDYADIASALDHLIYNDQCTPANPRQPALAEIRQLLIDQF